MLRARHRRYGGVAYRGNDAREGGGVHGTELMLRGREPGRRGVEFCGSGAGVREGSEEAAEEWLHALYYEVEVTL